MVVRGFTRMTRKGQITVPADVRRALGLKEGDRVAVRMDEKSGEARIQRCDSLVDATFGVLKNSQRFTPEQERELSRSARADNLSRKHASKVS